MNIPIPKSNSAAYKTMAGIMSGYYDTKSLVEFLAHLKTAQLPSDLLRAYLTAILDSKDYTINTQLFKKPVIDIVGMGGDGKDTVNISTLASLICAATGLVYVAKYGNRSASSICGSMDLLEALGITIELPAKQQVISQIKRVGFAPLYARQIYPGGKFVAEARKLVGKPTLFNLLFPLARPVHGKQRFIFGCATLEQMDIVARIFAGQPDIRCLIVHGQDGTDEISISGNGNTDYILVDVGKTTQGVFNCQELFGISPIPLQLLQITTKNEAITVFKAALDPSAKNKSVSAVRNAGIANAAMALFIGLHDGQTDIAQAKQYVAIASQVLSSDKVSSLVKQLSGKE